MAGRVLVVEDDDGVAGSIMGALDVMGIGADRAPTIAAANRLWFGDEKGRGGDVLFAAPQYAVILCDYELPPVDGAVATGRGTDFLTEVILDGGGGRAVLILWSGLDRSREVREQMPFPPDYVLTKERADAVVDLIARCCDDGARYVVETCHGGTDWCVRRATAAEAADEDADIAFTLAAALRRGRETAAEHGTGFFDFSASPAPEEGS